MGNSGVRSALVTGQLSHTVLAGFFLFVFFFAVLCWILTNTARLHLSTITQRTCAASHTRTGQTHESAPIAQTLHPSDQYGGLRAKGGKMEVLFQLEREETGNREVEPCVCVCARAYDE